MGSKPFNVVCFLWVIALHCISAANENDAIQFSSADPTPQVAIRTSERFPIPEVTQDPYYYPQLADMVATNVMQFAHDLGVVLDQDEFPNTQIFSPLSIMSALSMLHMGASGNTYQQLSKLFPMLAGGSGDSRTIHQEFGWMLQDIMLNQKNLQRPREEVAWRKTPANLNAFGKGGKKTPNEHTIRVANGLFVQEGYSLSPNYKFAAQSVYKSEVTPLDFRNQRDKAKHYINSWVSQNTLGKIPAVISDEIERDTEMILASALYFKGYWQQPFLGSGTAETNFYPDGPQQPPVRVMMMSFGGVLPFYDAPEYGCRIIGLPYKSNLTTMYVIQPYESTRRRLNDLQNILTGERINEIIAKMEQRTAVLAFPKFHVTNSLSLKKSLMQMGFRDVFTNRVSDLSLIADEGRYVDPATGGTPSLSSGQQSPTIRPRPASEPQQNPTTHLWPVVALAPERAPATSNQQSSVIQPRPEASNNWQTQQKIALPASTWPPSSSSVIPEGADWSATASTPARSPAADRTIFDTSRNQQSSVIQPRPEASNNWQTQQKIALPASTRPVAESSNSQTSPRQQHLIIQPRPQPPADRQVQQNLMESYGLLDQWNEPAFIVDKVTVPQQNIPSQVTTQADRRQLLRFKRTVTYKVESEFMRSNLPLRLKDLILSKRITKPNPGKKISRSRRQTVPESYQSLYNLDQLRSAGGLQNPNLHVDEVLHKVDFDVNEQGTEAAAVTLAYLRRSGTDVAFRCDTPFMLLIRHDPTKLPLFYGKINIPLP